MDQDTLVDREVLIEFIAGNDKKCRRSELEQLSLEALIIIKVYLELEMQNKSSVN